MLLIDKTHTYIHCSFCPGPLTSLAYFPTAGKPGIPGMNGTDGDKGVDGEKGDEGDKGSMGMIGDEGEKGDNGTIGEPVSMH